MVVEAWQRRRHTQGARASQREQVHESCAEQRMLQVKKSECTVKGGIPITPRSTCPWECQMLRSDTWNTYVYVHIDSACMCLTCSFQGQGTPPWYAASPLPRVRLARRFLRRHARLLGSAVLQALCARVQAQQRAAAALEVPTAEHSRARQGRVSERIGWAKALEVTPAEQSREGQSRGEKSRADPGSVGFT